MAQAQVAEPASPKAPSAGQQPPVRQPLVGRYSVTAIPGSLVLLARHHELLWHMIVRHLRAQYKQSVLGYAWILLSPLAQLLTLGFVFSVIFHSPSQGGAPFLLFLAIGLMPWIFFSSAVISGTDSIVGSANLVTNVYFPREVILVASVIVRLVDLIAGLVIIAGMMIWIHQPVSWQILWVPVVLCIHVLFVIGIALPFAAINLFFRDIRFLVGVLINLWFFLTPIMYSVDLVPERYRLLYDLNPNARFIATYRYALLTHVGPPLVGLLVAVAVSVLTFLFGYYLFKRMEPKFADSI